MSMRKIRADVEALAEKELALANENSPPFNSPHEGYAIILKEVEEMHEAIQNVGDRLHGLWLGVRGDGETRFDSQWIYDAALNAACEAVQVAAMCMKFKNLEKGGEDVEE